MLGLTSRVAATSGLCIAYWRLSGVVDSLKWNWWERKKVEGWRRFTSSSLSIPSKRGRRGHASVLLRARLLSPSATIKCLTRLQEALSSTEVR
jgi:hypothetical protein